MSFFVTLGALVVVVLAFGFVLTMLLRYQAALLEDNRRFQTRLMNAFVAKDWQQYAALELDLNTPVDHTAQSVAVNQPYAYGATEDELIQAALAATGQHLEGPLV